MHIAKDQKSIYWEEGWGIWLKLSQTGSSYCLQVKKRDFKAQQKNSLLFRMRIVYASAAIKRFICLFFVFVRTECGIKWYEKEYKGKNSLDRQVA